VRPGARRIALGNPRDDLEASAFRNPDGSVILVAMNRTDAPIPLGVTVGDDFTADTLPAHAIVTLVAGE